MKRLPKILTKNKIKLGVVLFGVIAVLIISMSYSNNNNQEIEQIHSLAQDVIIKAHLEVAPEGYTEIRTPEELEAINDNLAGKYILMQNIDMTGITHTIFGGQVYGESFSGTFDGNGYTISNLDIETNTQYIGMFGLVNNGGIIKNLILESINVTGKNTTQDTYIGGLIGYNASAATIENITIKGNSNITNELTTGSVYIGGLVGFSNGATTYSNIEINDINIIGNTSAALSEGGLIGYINNSPKIVENTVVRNSSLKSTENVNQNRIGGLIGYQRNCLVTNSYTEVEIIAKSKQGAADSYLGGLVGELYSPSTMTNVSNSYSKANITNEATGLSYVGGLLGYQHGYSYYSSGSYHSYYSTIEKVYATGNITIGTGKNCVGGLVGDGYYSIIQNAYSAVNIKGVNENTETALGGIVGEIRGSTITKNTYAIGSIVEDVATNNIGGIIGYNNNSVAPNNSYWPSNMSGDKVNNSTLGNKLSVQEMLDIDNYKDWDFNNIWAVVQNMSFPYLVNLPIPEEIYYDVKMQGKGTKEEPFIITTIEELKTISEWPAYFELGNDIDAAGIEDFNPINRFIGILDGKNHSINNLTIKSDSDYVGIFKENNGTIKNIKLSNLNIESSHNGDTFYIGAIAGYNRGTLKNIEIKGNIKNVGTVMDLYMGQISGYNEGLIEKTHSNGNLLNEGIVTNGYIGGITGYNDKNIMISYNTGNIDVSNINNVKVGGIVGKSNKIIKDSYSNGNLNVRATNANIGGIVGENLGIVKNTYSIDKIQKTVEEEKIGGIAGRNNTLITSSYWNIPNITEQSGNGEIKTLEELKQQFTYENWDFENIWNIEENVNTPVFKDIFNNDENYYKEEEYFGDDFWEWHTRTTTNDKAYNGKHIIINKGQSIDFYGYGVTSYKDYLYKYYTGAGEKTFMFKIDETKASYHTLDGAGFIFNASKKDNILSGYILLITENDINIYRLDNVNASQFETTESRRVQSYAGAPIASVPKNSSTMHNLMVKTSPTNVTVIDNGEEMLNVALDYSKHSGEDFGLIASYAQHDCSELTKIQFLEFAMEVKDYKIPVLKTDSQGNKLEGAKFQVKNAEGDIVREGTTNSMGVFYIKGLQEGTYTLEEIEAPVKHAFKNNTLTFKVTNDGKVLDVNTEEEIEIKIINEELKFVVKVEDVKQNPISGSKVNLYDEEGNAVIGSNGQPIVVTTGTDGTATVTDIEAGTYKFKQTEVSEDYILNDTTYTVTIEKDGTVTFKEDLDGVIVNKKYGHIVLTKYKTGTKIPLKDAVVEIKDTKGNNVRLTTNESGTITFKALPGTYTYKEITAPIGYVLNETTYTFTVADDGTVTYEGDTKGIIYNDRVTMTEGLTITKYRTNTTIGLAGATIAVFNETGEKVAEETTSENGQVTFTGLEVGSYYYKEISAPAGYVLNNTEYHFTVENDGSVTLADGVNKIIYNTRLTKDHIIIRKYITGTQTPVANAIIGLFDIEGNKLTEQTTNANGEVDFAGLEPGTYKYKELVAPSGYVLNDTMYTFTIAEDGTVTFDNANGIIYNNRVTMTEGLTITKKKTETDILVAGAIIGVFDADGKEMTRQTTKENGQVTFTGLEVGSYYYKEISAPAGYILNNTQYHFTVENDGTVSLANGVNKVIYNDRITMNEDLIITKYKTNTETPVAGAVIGVFDTEGNEMARQITDENGQVTFTGLEVGNYYYKEISAPAGYVLNNTEYHFTVENDGSVTLAEGTTKVIYNNRVTKDHVVITKYEEGTTIPVAGAVIGLFDASGNKLAEQTTNTNGQVDFAGLESGTYKYKELTAPNGYILNDTIYTFTIADDGTVTFDSANGIIYNSKILMTEGLTITKYKTNTETPVLGAVIGVFDTTGNKVAEETTKENGQVTFTGLEVGSYYYKEISAPVGYVLNNTEYHFTVENDGSVTLAEGTTKVIYNNRVTKDHVVITKYEEGTTIPVAGAVIGLFDASGNKLAEQTTNTNGQVDFAGLESGTYKYKELVAPNGYVLNETIYTFTIAEDGTLVFDSANGIIYNKKEEEKPEIIYGNITIRKYEKETTKGLEGAIIGIYDINGNAIVNKDGNAIQFITNANGEVRFKAKPGIYQYKELVAPAGYILDNTLYKVTVQNDGTVIFDSSDGIIYNQKEEKPDIPQEPEKPEIIYGEVTITKYEEGTQNPVAGAVIGIYDEQKNETKITTNENGTVKFKARPGVYQYQELIAPEGYILNNTIYTFTITKTGKVIFENNENGIIYNKKEEEKPEKPTTPQEPEKPATPQEPEKPVTPDVPNDKNNVIVPSDNTTIKNTTNQPVENLATGRLPQTGETQDITVIGVMLAIIGIYFGIKIKNKE